MIELCAICAEDREGRIRPLDGRALFICDRCEDEPVTSYDASSLGRSPGHTPNLKVGRRRTSVADRMR